MLVIDDLESLKSYFKNVFVLELVCFKLSDILSAYLEPSLGRSVLP